MRLSLYSDDPKAVRQGVTLSELIAQQGQHCDLWANAESSGSEGVYCEVARWHEDSKSWRRYAFIKFIGGEVEETPEATDWELAEAVVRQINGPVSHWSTIVHQMQTWVAPLSEDQQRTRMNIRNFLLTANMPELLNEYRISLDRKDQFRAACVRELALEWVKENF